MGSTLMHIGRGRAVDQQAEQFRTTVVPDRIHHAFALVDQRQVEVGNHHAFVGTQRLAEQLALR
ncbi:hypothetical protein D3C75_1329770 [compost metagenome]